MLETMNQLYLTRRVLELKRSVVAFQAYHFLLSQETTCYSLILVLSMAMWILLVLILTSTLQSIRHSLFCCQSSPLATCWNSLLDNLTAKHCGSYSWRVLQKSCSFTTQHYTHVYLPSCFGMLDANCLLLFSCSECRNTFRTASFTGSTETTRNKIAKH